MLARMRGSAAEPRTAAGRALEGRLLLSPPPSARRPCADEDCGCCQRNGSSGGGGSRMAPDGPPRRSRSSLLRSISREPTEAQTMVDSARRGRWHSSPRLRAPSTRGRRGRRGSGGFGGGESSDESSDDDGMMEPEDAAAVRTVYYRNTLVSNQSPQ
jgi:hypothetical protein